MRPGSPLTARLLPSGQRDASYQAANGPLADAVGERVLRFLVQPNGALLMAGSFTMAGTTPVHGFIRVLGSNGLDAEKLQAETSTVVWPVPTEATVHVALAPLAMPQQVELLDKLGRVVLSQAVAASSSTLALDMAALPVGVYVLRVHYTRGGPVVRRVVRP